MTRRAATLVCVTLAMPASAAAQTPLLGAVRDVAREVFIDPVVFDPLLTAPLTADPQAVIDTESRDAGNVTVTGHAAIRNGDDSYGLIASAPIGSTSGPTGAGPGIDPRGLRQHPTLGFDLTNIIWRPTARPALTGHLPAAAAEGLDPAARAALARAMAAEPLVAVPWALFFLASYQFNRSEYDFGDPSSPRASTHLNDTASLLVGWQTRATTRDPGYFFGASFVYSAVYRDQALAGGAAGGPPVKVRGNTLKVEMRRPIARLHAGVSPSYAFDTGSRVKTIDASVYLQAPRAIGRRGARLYGGVRGGYQTGTAGGFVGVFGGAVFRTADRGASGARD